MWYQTRKKEKERKRAREREYLAVHLTSVCICSNSLATDYRVASPRRVHLAPIPCRRPLPHFHPYSPISSALYLHPTPSLESIYHSTRGHGAVSRNRTRNVSKEAMYWQRNDSPLLARSFSCLFNSVSARRPLSSAHLIRTLPWIDIMQLSDVSRFRRDGRVDIISKSRLLIHTLTTFFN